MNALNINGQVGYQVRVLLYFYNVNALTMCLPNLTFYSIIRLSKNYIRTLFTTVS